MEFRGDVRARSTCGTGLELGHARTLYLFFCNAVCVGFGNNNSELREFVPFPKSAMSQQFGSAVPIGVQTLDIPVLYSHAVSAGAGMSLTGKHRRQRERERR